MGWDTVVLNDQERVWGCRLLSHPRQRETILFRTEHLCHLSPRLTPAAEPTKHRSLPQHIEGEGDEHALGGLLHVLQRDDGQ